MPQDTAMSEVRIIRPHDKRAAPLIKDRILIASGWASGDVVEISGECRRQGDETSIPPIDVKFPLGKSQGTKRRWVMFFRLDSGDTYRLKVIGRTASLELPPEEVIFSTRRFLVANTDIDWPEEDENVTARANDFDAGGPLATALDPDDVTLTYNGGAVGKIDVIPDPDGEGIWYASFDPLPVTMGTRIDLTLTVTDAASGTATVHIYTLGT